MVLSQVSRSWRKAMPAAHMGMNPRILDCPHRTSRALLLCYKSMHFCKPTVGEGWQRESGRSSEVVAEPWSRLHSSFPPSMVIAEKTGWFQERFLLHRFLFQPNLQKNCVSLEFHWKPQTMNQEPWMQTFLPAAITFRVQRPLQQHSLRNELKQVMDLCLTSFSFLSSALQPQAISSSRKSSIPWPESFDSKERNSCSLSSHLISLGCPFMLLRKCGLS